MIHSSEKSALSGERSNVVMNSLDLRKRRRRRRRRRKRRKGRKKKKRREEVTKGVQ